MQDVSHYSPYHQICYITPFRLLIKDVKGRVGLQRDGPRWMGIQRDQMTNKFFH